MTTPEPEAATPALLAIRRAAVMRHPTQLGIDHVDAGPARVGHLTVTVFFLPGAGAAAHKDPRPAALTAGQVRLWADDGWGGRLPQDDLHVTGLTLPPDTADAAEVAVTMAREPTATGYFLELTDVPRLDPFFMLAPFTLATVLLVEPSPLAPPADQPGEVTDYLARDFTSLRGFMLDRLTAAVPNWRDTEPTDLVHTVVELLAYAGDRLSYFQDAVGTEAYLGTARLRTSVRRHARLLGYTLHQGCNARVWTQFTACGAEPVPLPAGTQLLTSVDATRREPTLLDPAAAARAVDAGATVFETVYDAMLHPGLNSLVLYDWGLPGYGLPAGATAAALGGRHPDLAVGQVLLLRAAPGAGLADEGLSPAHPVRLTAVGDDEDAVGDGGRGVQITWVRWAAADALPFPIAASAAGQGRPGTASANVVLADHGRTGPPEPVPPPTGDGPPGQPAQLARTGLTWREPPAASQAAPASAVRHRDPRQAIPALHVTSTDKHGGTTTWIPRPDLLASSQTDPHFVVEMEDSAVAYLRFGDGINGRPLAAGDRLTATYRVGNGAAGNIGRAALAHLAAPVGATGSDTALSRIKSVTNPLPAEGGTGPEPKERVRLLAPHSFLEQERCVVEADFVRVAESHPQVRRAAASFRWAGSWLTAVVVVDRVDGLPVDPAFHDELRAWFEPYRLAGGDLAISGPRIVLVDIVVEAAAAAGHRADGVEQELAAAFGTGTRPDGTPAFFNPVSRTIGQPLYLSQVVACAAALPGVAWADVVRFQRRGQPDGGELHRGVLAVAPQEVLRARPGDVGFAVTGADR